MASMTTMTAMAVAATGTGAWGRTWLGRKQTFALHLLARELASASVVAGPLAAVAARAAMAALAAAVVSVPAADLAAAAVSGASSLFWLIYHCAGSLEGQPALWHFWNRRGC